MIGKEAYDYVQKNRDIIDKLIVADYEGNGIKCLYYKSVDEIMKDKGFRKSYFQDDDGNWATKKPYSSGGDVAYTILLGVTFKVPEDNMEIDVCVKGFCGVDL